MVHESGRNPVRNRKSSRCRNNPVRKNGEKSRNSARCAEPRHPETSSQV